MFTWPRDDVVDVDGSAGVLSGGFGLVLEPSGLVGHDRRAAPEFHLVLF
jgi:hypothetical protein